MSDTPRDRDDNRDDKAAATQALSAAYRAEAREQPPQALDARVLAAAHRAVRVGPRAEPAGRGRRRWLLPAASAAVLVLGVALTLRMHEATDKSVPIPDMAPLNVPASPMEQPAATMEKAKKNATDSVERSAELPAAAAPRRTPAADNVGKLMRQDKAETGSAAPATGSAGLQDTMTLPASTAKGEIKPAPSPASPEIRGAAAAPFATPKAWWAHIRELQQQGRREEAAASLEALKRAYPGVPVPSDLRGLDTAE